ncbi:MAG: hypothetical protein JSV91_05880 [Phycisphaerales bacterium]|nr:MAG: hypothetical protein JSV91_05880 [Phycisphaerales bacterium]
MIVAFDTVDILRRLRFRDLLVPALLAFLCTATTAAQVEQPSPASRSESNFALLEEVWGHVNERFFDPDFNGADWPAMIDRYGEAARQAETDADLANVITAMLGELNTSHTAYFTKQDPKYYQLLDVFHHLGRAGQIAQMFPEGEVRCAETGMVTKVIDGKVFVTGIIDGTLAEAAGVLVGDEIISVDGRPYLPHQSARRDAGPPETFTIKRSADAESILELTFAREVIRPTEMFLRAMSESVAVAEHNGISVGYVHIWSWAGEHYQDRLVELLQSEPLRDADALVLDIRDGWGGARPRYVNIFRRDLPVMLMKTRDEDWTDGDPQWRKPVVLLINEGSRSGKEIIAYTFKSCDIGPVVGTTTGGAVTGGTAIVLSDGSLLYLAVGDVLIDGKRLEGVGVEPDIFVPFDVRYAAGVDPQRQRAIEVAAEEVRRERR